jgi:hypothetical protein
MKRVGIVALSAFGAVACVAAAFWLGFREGASYGDLINTTARGVLATRALIGLNNEQPRVARLLFESQVDRGLLSAHDFLDSPIRSLIGAASGAGTSVVSVEGNAIQLANYRKANASPFHDYYLAHHPGETPEQRAEIDDAAKRHDDAVRTIESMVERYASQ